MPKQPAVDSVWIFAGPHHEFVEAWRAREQDLGMLAELRGSVIRLRQILFCQFLEADFAVDGHEDVDHQRDQGLVGADIRSRFFPADVLFACGQRQNKSAFAVAVRGLTGEASGHLANELFASGYHTAVRTAESERNSKRLRFH